MEQDLNIYMQYPPVIEMVWSSRGNMEQDLDIYNIMQYPPVVTMV
jgi:hypothetical protein